MPNDNSTQADWSAERDALLKQLQMADIGLAQSRALARALSTFDREHLGMRQCGCKFSVLRVSQLGKDDFLLIGTKGQLCSEFHVPSDEGDQLLAAARSERGR